MSSILTNSSAMVALQTLQKINGDLGQTQNEISTGKSVSSAKDNSAIWAISKVMESDVSGFQAISESLSLGESTIAVARQSTETITDLLTEIKGKVVASQEENVDRDKLQTDIAALRDQINSVVGSAQFNGLNMLKGTEDVSVLSSLDRSSDGTVSASHIDVKRQDLTTSVSTVGAGAAVSSQMTATATAADTANDHTMAISGTIADNADYTIKVDGQSFTINTGSGAGKLDAAGITNGLVSAVNEAEIDGITATNSSGIQISSTKAFESTVIESSTTDTPGNIGAGATVDARAEDIVFSNAGSVDANRSYEMDLGGTKVHYTAKDGDTQQDVAAGLKSRIDMQENLSDVSTKVEKIAGEWTLRVDNGGSTPLAITNTVKDGGTIGGGLELLADIDVSSERGAQAALAAIEGLIGTSIDAAAEFGSSERRIDVQSDFVSKLTDSLKTGIGSLVDADMEEASARLQALQVQQQLATQSLSIANSQPENLLSLFQ
jgi:flagellin